MKNQSSGFLKGVIMCLITVILWGVLPIALKMSLPLIDVYGIAWFRFAFAAIGINLLIGARKKHLFAIYKRPPRSSIIASIALAANYVCYFKGVEYLSPTAAQVLIQCSPIFLVILSLIILKEQMKVIQYIGLGCTLSGFILFYKDQIPSLLGELQTYNLGILWVITGGFTWAIYGLLQKKLVDTYAPQQVNLIIYSVAAFIFIPITDFTQFIHLNFMQWLLIIFLGLNTIIAYGTLSEAFHYLPANQVSIIITLAPLVTMIAMGAMHYFNVSWIPYETIKTQGYFGALMIILGAILVVGMRANRSREQE